MARTVAKPVWSATSFVPDTKSLPALARRLHKKPNTAEIEACHPWIDAELRAVGPSVIVALGATAARSLFGRTTSIAASRGDRFDVHGRPALVTYHPSAVLRADERAIEIRHALVADLQLACAWAVR